MEFSRNSQEESFAEEVRTWLEEHLVGEFSDLRNRGGTGQEDIPVEILLEWEKELATGGWLGLDFPEELGGRNCSLFEQVIFHQTYVESRAPGRIPNIGVTLLAPTLVAYGTNEQQERFIPEILNGSEFWCQGYSEPDAGSDLANITTRASSEGDHWVVNGQKIWTSNANYADMIFCLVRTETTPIKQEGISFLLIDMKSPGIEVKPIITIDGSHEVNMVYFDNVEVPQENLIGEEGQGWNIAKFLLAHERSGIAGIAALKRELNRLKELSSEIPLGESTLLEDPQFRSKIEETEIELTATEFTELRTLAAMSQGGSPGAESSILKIKGTELQQTISELFVEMLAYYAHPFYLENEIGSNETVGPDYAAPVMPHYLNYRKVTIYGGSNEIQRNVISKAILGL